MALKLRLKAGERLAVNGAVLRNVSGRAVELEFLNEATLLQERDILLPEEADSALKQIYLPIQLMHLEPSDHAVHHKSFVRGASTAYAAALVGGDPATCELIDELVVRVGERDLVGALKRLQKVIGRPGAHRTGGDDAA